MLLMLCVLIVDVRVITMRRIRTYTELIRLNTFKDRFDYLKLDGRVGDVTFGYDRILNQILYNSGRWKRLRNNIIIRDEACDLGVEGYDIYSRIIVHHMNPITIEDVEMERPEVYNPEFLICVSHNTHNAITYGNESLLPKMPIERSRNDTCPWR